MHVWSELATGDGPVLLLLPGAGSSSHLWLGSFTKRLQELGLRPFLLDPRDTGRTPDTAEPYTIVEMAEDAIEAAIRSGVGAFHVLGYSLGGAVGLTLAGRHGDRCLSLTTVNSFSPDLSLGFGETAFACATYEPGALLASLMGPHDPDDELAYRSLDSRADSRFSARSVQRHQEAGMLTVPPTRDDVSNIAIPSLIVQGTADTSVPIGHAHCLQDWLPQARLILVDQMGHAPTPQQWEAIAGHVAGHVGAHSDPLGPAGRRT